jgi:hypothetical protein
MIVIGVDVHKYSLTAVAVDELGRAFTERSSIAVVRSDDKGHQIVYRRGQT